MAKADGVGPLLAEWPQRGRDWLAMLAVGTVIGIDNAGFAIAIGALLFAGPLAGGLELAVSGALISTVIGGVALALFSRITAHVGHVQDLGAAVLAQVLAATAASAALPEDARVASALVVVALASVASGVLLWTTGRFGWGSIARYFPQSVLAGFLAGSGWLLVAGGVSVAAGIAMPDLFSPVAWTARAAQHALPALAFAAILWVVLRRVQWSGGMVAMLVAGVAGFHVMLWVMAVPLAVAQATGWVPSAGTGAAAIPNLAALAGVVDWRVVGAALPAIVTVAFLTMLGALMNTSALEAVTGQDTDSNRELRVTGLANLAIAAFAGPPAYSGFASSLMAVRAGIVWRGTGLVMAVVALFGLVAAGTLIAMVPVFLMTGLIIYLGFDLLNDWLLRTRHVYSRAEWAVVAAILGIVITLGFFKGIVAGLLIACVIFVWSYAAVPILRRTGSLRNFSSTLSRGPAEAAWLRAEGDRVAVAELQGFLFFGTADQLRDLVRKRIADREKPPLAHLILDLRRVVGLDAAAAAQLQRIAALAAQHNVALVLSGFPPGPQAALLRAVPDLVSSGAARLVPTLDEALEQAEDAVLAMAPQAQLPNATMVQRLVLRAADLPLVAGLLAALPLEHLPRGSVVMRAGEIADSLVFLEQGRVVIRAPSAGTDGPRLRAMAAGAVLGDIGLALQSRRTADVLADTDVVLRRLTLDHLARIERDDVPLGLALLRLQCRSLAEKIVFDERIKGPTDRV